MMNPAMIHNMSDIMAEDAGLFELRNPNCSGMRAEGWIFRLLKRTRRSRSVFSLKKPPHRSGEAAFLLLRGGESGTEQM